MGALAYTSYDSGLSRVLIDLATVQAAIGSDDTGLVERSLDQIRWTTVRGGTAVALTAASPPLADYEFTDGVINYYRVTPTASTYTDSITPDLAGQVWVKSLRFAFLNRAITVGNVFDGITRASRSGVFDVLNRSYPVAVSQVRGARQWTLQIICDGGDEADAVNAITAADDLIFLQPPAGSDIPGGYFLAGDTAESWVPGSRQPLLSWPLTEVAAPGPDVVPVSVTWQAVMDAYGSWSDLIADKATWTDVLELVGAPADVYAP
jgi:hypothetical protein